MCNCKKNKNIQPATQPITIKITENGTPINTVIPTPNK